jgi:16S rRNA (cytosine1402-N4)-methyltransferase
MAHFAEASRAKHIPVLLHESIEALNLEAGEIFLDATFGGGGHSREVLERFDGNVRIIALDRDPKVLEALEQSKTFASSIEVKIESFRNLDKALEELKVESVDAVLFDLGISTDQLENSGRGFSFQKNEPLDMRMSGQGLRAADILNSWDEHTLELILRGFGEETYSRKIAKEMVKRRALKPFSTTFDLIEAVFAAKGQGRRDKIHPATKTFQALRIAVNEELTALEIGLEKAFRVLKSKGRLVVISFHSLEDRIVKNFFRDKVREETAQAISKKPITPKPDELLANPRSRSAKLRVIEKI